MQVRFSARFAGLTALLLLPALTLPAAKKPTIASGRGENEDLVLTATLHIDPEDIKELIGSDLGGHYSVAERAQPDRGPRRADHRRSDQERRHRLAGLDRDEGAGGAEGQRQTRRGRRQTRRGRRQTRARSRTRPAEDAGDENPAGGQDG